ncbi:MAG: DUF4266 domain-containing protein [Candidatus Eisenbacteria bacterium]|uniref:DUF4266 domain-containing protein n=1 Tax=Eiseniibacteriota bacterium TaxID=2212470 RepID=A0A948RXU9_UNCEI|nr:DUF4266 domain-containing protein [Candidatus Eisenbacteria bacterium]MBU1950789.1 DUF4266 domain-containing protein [Candidatus Eisenbacteria bacterium]MBU2691589.1 DUF4266 domain-containing protein [Candidatus Eisenbacteria bacterium]
MKATLRPGARLSFLLLAASLLFTVFSSCARVQPWERDLLADPRMQADANRVQNGIDDHIYFSKEASSGGGGFGGGGCGCN